MTERSLIIEGEPALREELASALSEAGFATADVSNFPEALLKLDEFNPDIVIVDEVLSSGDGMETCHRLHGTLGIPIIVLGKQSGGKIWKKAVDAGADCYLKKPFSSRVLVARVKAILRRYRLSAPRSGNEL